MLRMKISTGMTLVQLLMTAALLVAVSSGWWSARVSEQQINQLYDIGVERNQALEKTFVRLLRARTAMAGAYMEMEAKQGSRVQDSLQLTRARLDDASQFFQHFKELPSFADWKPLENRLDAAFNAYLQVVNEQRRALEENSSEHFAQINLRVRAAHNEFEQASQAFHDKLSAYTGRVMAETAQRADMAVVSAVLLLALPLLLMFCCWLYVSRHVLGPLREAGVYMERMARGDLRHEIEVKSDNEIGDLFHSLKQMQNTRREVIERIGSCAGQLAGAAMQLSTITEQGKRGLEQQHQELELAATAVNQMTQAVAEVAKNAESTSAASERSNQLAVQSREQVRANLREITNMSSEIQTTSEQVQDLAQQARQIGTVLDVIRAVSEQTNLLALNAAIEAARAGEAGRGFAVVADEVRTLAQRTGESTREIEQMVEGIQSGSEQALSSMLSSTRRAQTTLEATQTCGTALEDIFKALDNINERNLLIASAATEQAQVAREVDRNLLNIRDLSGNATDGAEQTRSASGELSRLAVELNSMIEQFKS